MLMYPDNPSSASLTRPLPPFRPFPTLSFLPTQSAAECMPEMCAKLQSFHVEIRSRSLREYKERIRSEFMSTAIIDELLQSKPMDGHSAREWARQLGREYGKTEKYVLCMDKAVEVFKLVEKFPSKETLELLEVVTLRAGRETINELFQYDVMRLLHRFANFEEGVSPREAVGVSVEEVEMMREVVITESLSPSPSRQERVQLARGAVRVIAGLCRKAQHIRNFAVLNHKTFVYCLRCLNAFGESIQLQFSMFLEAATHYPFGRRGEEQYKRITTKIIKSFFHDQMNIRIELFLDGGQSSCLRAYDFLINALANLIRMGDPETLARIMAAKTAQQLGVTDQLASLVSRCAYVMNFPAVSDSREEVTPMCIVSSTIQLMLHLEEQMEKMPTRNYNATPLFREIYRFVSLRTLPLAHPTSIVVRRGLYFLTSNRLYDQLTEEDLLAMVYYSQDEQENLISLLAYYLEVEVDGLNASQLASTIKIIFERGAPHIIQPLLLPSGMMGALVERMLSCDYNRSDYLISVEQSMDTMLLSALEAFFAVFGQQIGGRVTVYKQIVMEYAERLYAKYDTPNCPREMAEKARNILSMCQNQQSLEEL